MKRIFSIMFAAAMLSMVLVACGNDEPNKTAKPVIASEVQGNEVIAQATGNGEVLLYSEGELTTNPVSFLRAHDDYSVTLTATAQEEGKEISDKAKLVLEVPKSDNPNILKAESIYENVNNLHFAFDIDMSKDLSYIYLYNIIFTIGTQQSPALNVRIDAPVTYDKNTATYTFSGTGLPPYQIRGGSLIPMTDELYRVNDLTCTINLKNKTYSITFDCHGGHYDSTGYIK